MHSAVAWFDHCHCDTVVGNHDQKEERHLTQTIRKGSLSASNDTRVKFRFISWKVTTGWKSDFWESFSDKQGECSDLVSVPSRSLIDRGCTLRGNFFSALTFDRKRIRISRGCRWEVLCVPIWAICVRCRFGFVSFFPLWLYTSMSEALALQEVGSPAKNCKESINVPEYTRSDLESARSYQ